MTTNVRNQQIFIQIVNYFMTIPHSIDEPTVSHRSPEKALREVAHSIISQQTSSHTMGMGASGLQDAIQAAVPDSSSTSNTNSNSKGQYEKRSVSVAQEKMSRTSTKTSHEQKIDGRDFFRKARATLPYDNVSIGS
jgi:hypothetical protein